MDGFGQLAIKDGKHQRTAKPACGGTDVSHRCHHLQTSDGPFSTGRLLLCVPLG